MNKKTVTVEFDTIEVRKSLIDCKVYSRFDVQNTLAVHAAVDAKDLYILDNFKVKGRKIESFETVGRTSLLIKLNDGKTSYQLNNPTKGENEAGAFDSFLSRLEAVSGMHNGSSSLDNETRPAAAKRGRLGDTSHTAAMLPNGRKRAKRGVFGSQSGIRQSSVKDDAFFPQWVDERPAKNPRTANTFDDDDDDDDMSVAESGWEDHGEPTRGENESDQEELVQAKGNGQRTKRLTKMVGKARRTSVFEDDSDSSDSGTDFLRDSLDMTTPSAATQRVVSPSTKTANTKATKTTTLSSASPEEVLAKKDSSQPTISKFFQPAKRGIEQESSTLSLSLASPSTNASSPIRKIGPSSAASSSRTIQKSQKRAMHQKNDWLNTSPTRMSSELRRKRVLLGKNSALELLNQTEEEDRVVSTPGNIQTPPRSQKRLNLTKKAPVGDSFVRRQRSNSLLSRSSNRNTYLNIYLSPRVVVNNDDDDNKRKRQLFRGLQNLGNTCFLNASLQMLYTAADFVASVENKGGQLTRSVVSVAGQLKAKAVAYATAVNPISVKKAIDIKTDKFLGYEQRDAHEFLADMIDHIHEELEEEHKKKNKQKAQAEAEVPKVNNSEEQDRIEIMAAEPSMPSSPPHPNNKAVEQMPKEMELDPSSSPPNENTNEQELKEVVLESKSPSAPNNKAGDEGCLADDGDTIVVKPQPEQAFLPTDAFRSTVQVCLKCDSCGYSRTKEEIYTCFSVDILNKEPSVESSVSHFFQPEVREIKCEKCSEGTHASQRLLISSRPRFLLLHLKRFIFVEKPLAGASGEENCQPNGAPAVEYVFQKNKAAVKIPGTLTLDPFCVDQSTSQSALYSLKSIVHHHGSRASSGHYTADALRSLADSNIDPPSSSSGNGEDATEEPPDPFPWVIFDDTSTGLTSLKNILSKRGKQESAYMLLYSLEDENKEAPE